MDIKKAIRAINKELNTNISADYYSNIEEWRKWWAGYNEDFHKLLITIENGKKKHIDMFTLKMAKKVCEDWASIIMNEDIKINVENTESKEFINEVFDTNNFYTLSNQLIEKAFWSGTGAYVLKIKGLNVSSGGNILQTNDASISIESLSGACIVPLSIENEQITEAAFITESIIKGNKLTYIQYHVKEKGKYVILNKYYKNQGQGITEVEIPEDVIPRINTNSDYKWFEIIKPNKLNPIAGNMGLGESVFADALDVLKELDIIYNNYGNDFKLGGKKIFYNRRLTQTKSDGKGGVKHIAPDEVMQQMFVINESDNLDEKSLIHEHNPKLRVDENIKAIQNQLELLGFKCGLGAKYYQFNEGRIITAAEYLGSKQDLKQNANKHETLIKQAIESLITTILFMGKELMGASVDPNTQATVIFSDGYIVSDEVKKEQDRLDVDRGLMLPWEYRVKYLGEEEDAAKKILGNTNIVFNDREGEGDADS